VNPESVFDNEYKTLQVYPNPASDVINITNSSKLHNIRIYSITGSLVYQSEVVKQSIDISSLNKGTYFIHAAGDNGEQFASKIIVN